MHAIWTRSESSAAMIYTPSYPSNFSLGAGSLGGFHDAVVLFELLNLVPVERAFATR